MRIASTVDVSEALSKRDESPSGIALGPSVGPLGQYWVLLGTPSGRDGAPGPRWKSDAARSGNARDRPETAVSAYEGGEIE